ncbi:MAG: hypothetical protein AAGJ10_13595 [Bacteroidota bacterium]
MLFSSTTRRYALWPALLLWACAVQGCTPPAQHATPLVVPFFATHYHLPDGQQSDSLLAAAVRQGVLDLTPLLAAAPTWPKADSTVRAFLEAHAKTPAYAPLAQISARAMIRHRLLAPGEAMSAPKAETLHRYLHLMYDQGSRDLVLMQRGVDSLYVLEQDSILVQWQVKLRTLAPAPLPSGSPSDMPAPPEQPPA